MRRLLGGRGGSALVLGTFLLSCGPSLKQQEEFTPKRVKEVKFSDECKLQSYFDDNLTALRVEGESSISADESKGWAGEVTFVIQPGPQLETFRGLLGRYYQGLPSIPTGQPLRVTVVYLEKTGAEAGLRRQLPINAAAQLQLGDQEHALPYHPCLDAFFYGRGYYEMRARVLDPRAHAMRQSSRKTAPTLITELADPDPALRKEAQARLVQMGGEAVPELLLAFMDPRRDLREAITEILPLMCGRTKAMIPPLLAAMADPSQMIRFHSAVALLKLAPALLRELEDPDPNLRVKAAEALAQMEVRGIIPILLVAMQTRGQEQQRDAIAALVVMGSRAAPALRRGVASPDHRIRVTSLQALGKMGAAARSAIQEIKRAARASSPEVRAAAKAALDQINTARTPAP